MRRVHAVPHEQLPVTHEHGLRPLVVMPIGDLKVASRRQGEVLPVGQSGKGSRPSLSGNSLIAGLRAL